MVIQILAKKSPILLALLIATIFSLLGQAAMAATVFLPNGEPDPNCPELRLWLRADSGIKDAQGRGPEDPHFDGRVAAWHDRSLQKFDLGASPAQSPFFVPSQPAAGNQPTVAFGGEQILARTGSSLYDRPTSTVILVLFAEPRHANIFSVGKAANARERITISWTADAEWAWGLGGSFMSNSGERQYEHIRLKIPVEGRGGRRFGIIIANGQADRRTLEFHDGMVNMLGGDRSVAPIAPAQMASDKCGPDIYLGGSDGQLLCGQVAEVIVFNRGLSSVEQRDILKYVRRRYEFDKTDVLFPNTIALRAGDFAGDWKFESDWRIASGYYGSQRLTAEGKAADDGIKGTINVPRNDAYHVWVRATENAFNANVPATTGLRTTIQGKELQPTHVRGPGGVAWREAGKVELEAGPAEVLIRGEGPGNKDCHLVLISPTADANDKLDDICAFAQYLRRLKSDDCLTAIFDNGMRLNGSLATGWRVTDVSGQATRLDPIAMPSLVCLQTNSSMDRPAAEFESIIELQNGDRLRGAISGYVPATAQTDKTAAAPAQLLICPMGGFFERREQAIAVDTDWVRRIIFQSSPRDRRCPPQTLICRNGRAYVFKAIRWGEKSLSLLTDDGVERIAVNEVAELRMPIVDAWDRYFRELASIDPELKAGVVRVETLEGIAMTAAVVPPPQSLPGNKALPRARLLQPVWSRQPISVPWASTCLIWQAPASMVPLSRFAPEQVEQRGILGSSWKQQTDRNVAGDILENGGIKYLWGFGVHAPCNMVFQLPDCVRAFRSNVGIDSAVGSSGCVIAKVYLKETTGTPLYESKRLVGLEMAVSTGEVALPPASGGQRKLVLATESAGDLRGEKGDPLDIGNHVDWLEPVLLLDPDLLRAEVAKHLQAATR